MASAREPGENGRVFVIRVGRDHQSAPNGLRLLQRLPRIFGTGKGLLRPRAG